MSFKVDWYQSDGEVFINLLRLKVDPSQCAVSFQSDDILIVRHQQEVIFSVVLAHSVEPIVKVNFGMSKGEIVLKKRVLGQWNTLERKKSEQCVDGRKNYAEHWDNVVKEVEADPECDARDGVNKFFQTLDDDGKKAMMKSMSESAGTVLSTNWSEVKKDKVVVKPPDGMEFRKYD